MFRLEKFIEIQDGQIVDNYFPEMEDGRYLLTLLAQREPKNIEEYRAEYFAKRDILAEFTGFSKKELHNQLKLIFLNGESTKTLDVDGWQTYIKHICEWGAEEFNCLL